MSIDEICELLLEALANAGYKARASQQHQDFWYLQHVK